MRLRITLMLTLAASPAMAQTPPPQPTISQVNAAMSARLGEANVQLVWLNAELDAMQQIAMGEPGRAAKAVADAVAKQKADDKAELDKAVAAAVTKQKADDKAAPATPPPTAGASIPAPNSVLIPTPPTGGSPTAP